MPPPAAHDLAQAQHRVELEQAERDMRERANELRVKEREIEMRVRELDRERARLTSERMEMYGSGNEGSVRPVQSPQQQQQQQQQERIEFPVTPSPEYARQQYPSDRRLGPPPDSQHQTPVMRSRAPSGSPRPRHHSLSQGWPQESASRQAESGAGLKGDHQHREHAAFCGCEHCSVQKYKTPVPVSGPAPTAGTSSPTARPQQPVEKSKSWMRRLSMPVGMSAAFSLDSKKGPSGGAGLRNQGVLEDGRRVGVGDASRRSYEANAASNWSLTSLAGRR